jgi:hypothetical protein
LREISVPEDFECTELKPDTSLRDTHLSESEGEITSPDLLFKSFSSSGSNPNHEVAANSEQNCNYVIKNLNNKLFLIKKDIHIKFKTVRMDSFKLRY